MQKNIQLTQGRTMSEAIMIALIKKGINRQEAHELLRKLTIKSKIQKQPFKETLSENNVVRKKLNEKEIEDNLTPSNYLGTTINQIRSMIEKTRKERQSRRLQF